MAEDELAQRRRAAERRERALRLRVAGVAYASIAERLGYETEAAASEDVGRALDIRAETLAAERESGAALRLELERLDAIQLALETTLRSASSNGDQRLVLAAADQMLRLGAQRARLMGIDVGDEGPAPYGGPDELLRNRQRERLPEDDEP